MELSVWPTAYHPWHDLRDLAQHAEGLGFHGVWVMDHFMDNTELGGGHVLEGFTVLAGLAAVTRRVRLGSLVAGNLYRHPAVLANQAATIDVMSDGRFVLGLGAGWQVNEHEQYGIQLPATGPRLRQFEEACRVVKALRDEPVADLDGRYYQLRGAQMEPKPVGPMPLLIGGAGEQVMAGIVARQADEWNIWGDPGLFARKDAIFRRACEAEGRDPATLRRTVNAMVALPGIAAAPPGLESRSVGGSVEALRDALGRYAEAGVDEFIATDGHVATERRTDPARSRELFEVLASLRAD